MDLSEWVELGRNEWWILLAGSVIAVVAVYYFRRPDTSVHGRLEGRFARRASFDVSRAPGPVEPGAEVIDVRASAYPDEAVGAMLTRTEARELARHLRDAAAFKEEAVSGTLGTVKKFTVSRREAKPRRYVEIELVHFRFDPTAVRPMVVRLTPTAARKLASVLMAAAGPGTRDAGT